MMHTIFKCCCQEIIDICVYGSPLFQVSHQNLQQYQFSSLPCRFVVKNNSIHSYQDFEHKKDDTTMCMNLIFMSTIPFPNCPHKCTIFHTFFSILLLFIHTQYPNKICKPKYSSHSPQARKSIFSSLFLPSVFFINPTPFNKAIIKFLY